MNRITVIGSSNLDLTARVRTLPRPGETIGGATLIQANGGKGANQAVAAARLGADVLFATCVGNDASGDGLVASFVKDGIDVSKVKRSSLPTGTALIFVDDAAENCIAVAPGANNDMLPSDIDAIRQEMADSAFLLLQLEIPIPAVVRAVRTAGELGVKVVLNPAPTNDVPDEVFDGLFLITPNETEAEKFTGVTIKNAADARKAAEVLFAKGVRNVIVTMGGEGSLLCTPETTDFIPARKVNAVDTTAAGDVYNGALVAAFAEGKGLKEAAQFATLASSVAVTRLGAQTSAPYRHELDNL